MEHSLASTSAVMHSSALLSVWHSRRLLGSLVIFASTLLQCLDYRYLAEMWLGIFEGLICFFDAIAPSALDYH